MIFACKNMKIESQEIDYLSEYLSEYREENACFVNHEGVA